MSRAMFAIIAVVSLSVAGCVSEADARQELEAKGYTNITVTKAGDGFKYTADKEDAHCTGTISISKGLGSKQVRDFSSCVAK